jgi:hypothetical protein
VLNGSNSKWTDVTSGIPQWSDLGPIVFTIYIHDLHLALLGGLKCTCLHLDLLKVNNQSCDHCIILSISPCSFLSSFVLFTQSTEEKDLGIIILDEKFKFQIHFNNQTNKANQRLGMIKRSFIYIVNSMGPWTLHWGIPLVTSVHFQLDPLSTTFCLRSNKSYGNLSFMVL